MPTQVTTFNVAESRILMVIQGRVQPAPLAPFQVLPAAWRSFDQASSDLTQTTVEPSVEDLEPEADEIANQPFEVMVDYEPMDHLIVKALKGGVLFLIPAAPPARFGKGRFSIRASTRLHHRPNTKRFSFGLVPSGSESTGEE
jgi:hypothetical protein